MLFSCFLVICCIRPSSVQIILSENIIPSEIESEESGEYSESHDEAVVAGVVAAEETPAPPSLVEVVVRDRALPLTCRTLRDFLRFLPTQIILA